MTVPSPSPVRVGVVGLGRSGFGIHVKAFEQLADRFQVVAVADTDTARAKETAESLPACAAYSGIEELLADDAVEMVVVASPNRYHAPHVIAALTAGKHAICEKPFGLNVAEVDAMLAARDAAGEKTGRPVFLAPFQNRRFEQSFEKVRAILCSGQLGRIVHIRMAYHSFGRRWDWQTLQRFGGGQLNNNCPHPVDQAMEFFADAGITNPDEITVWANLRNTLSSGDAEDHVRLTLRAPAFPDAPTIDIEFTAACAYPQDQWLVMGTSGGLKGSAKHLEWKWVDWSAMPPRPVDERSTQDRSYNRETLTWQEESCEVSEPFPGINVQFYKALYPALRQGEPLLITPESIRRRIAILEKARAAAAAAP